VGLKCIAHYFSQVVLRFTLSAIQTSLLQFCERLVFLPFGAKKTKPFYFSKALFVATKCGWQNDVTLTCVRYSVALVAPYESHTLRHVSLSPMKIWLGDFCLRERY